MLTGKLSYSNRQRLSADLMKSFSKMYECEEGLEQSLFRLNVEI
jgi:hypothetical protein